MNFIANFLGLGMAATPAGLKAMKDLENLEEKRRGGRLLGRTPVPPGTASREMCTFLIMNISSLQLIPVTMIAYRSQYGSVNPRRHHRPGDSGYRGKHRCGGDFLRGDEPKNVDNALKKFERIPLHE